MAITRTDECASCVVEMHRLPMRRFSRPRGTSARKGISYQSPGGTDRMTVPVPAGLWMSRVRLTAAPVDGAANEALVALLAERLGVSKRQVVVVRGATSRQKVVEVVGLKLEDVKQRLSKIER